MRISKKTKGRLWTAAKLAGVFLAFMVAVGLIWVSTFDIPNIDGFANRQVQQSTKIYDRTGEIVLYDLNKDVRRTKVPLAEISDNLKNASIAIEDEDFYTHYGIEPSAILRATWTNLKSLAFEQGGSTITQQVVKNTLLTPKKTIARKVKEWILAIRLDADLSKDEILEIYLNETPYGGRVYGAEEAADRYFGKTASELSIVESAYLAALPKAPTYYSPYGNNRDQLEARKDDVLRAMRENDYITEEEFDSAIEEDVTFLSQDDGSIRAPHFVFFIKEYLEEEYGTDAIERRGLKITTTLNYDLQKRAEEVLAETGAANAERFNAGNAALVAVDPETGQILSMVGSRDYENEEIEGNFNAATAARQPGSSFKPFVYATAINNGYTDSTVVFDLPTQFSTACPPNQFNSNDGCFGPVNYDGKFRGPITFRNALAQSINIPAVKALYLAGMNDSLDTARAMGLSTLDKNPDQYGLSLVLGAGEVTPLDLTSAYGVFANDGIRNEHTGILKIEDNEGEVLEEFEKNPERVLPAETARTISSILSDNAARAPDFGTNSPLYFPGNDVAAKTGTTNNFRDLWTVGYNPKVAVGIWSGNNDNTPINGEIAGFVVAPMWQEVMQAALEEVGSGNFTAPAPEGENLKPVLAGQWRGGYGESRPSGIFLDERDEEPSGLSGGVHNILHWVDKRNPRGPVPTNPASDSQYENWEFSVRRWAGGGGFGIDQTVTEPEIDLDGDEDSDGDSNGGESEGFLEVTGGLADSYDEDDRIEISAENNGTLDRLELYINDELVDDDDSQPFAVYFEPNDYGIEESENNLRLVGISEDGDEESISRTFSVED